MSAWKFIFNCNSLLIPTAYAFMVEVIGANKLALVLKVLK